MQWDLCQGVLMSFPVLLVNVTFERCHQHHAPHCFVSFPSTDSDGVSVFGGGMFVVAESSGDVDVSLRLSNVTAVSNTANSAGAAV